eukprot:1357773-Pyramimonas_sp.AAC.1
MDKRPAWMLEAPTQVEDGSGEPAAKRAASAAKVVEAAKKQAGGQGDILKQLVIILTKLSLTNAAELRDICGV